VKFLKKSYFALFTLIILIALPILNFSSVLAQSENSWVAKSSMPNARSGFGVAVAGGNVYAIGGYNKNQTNFLAVNEMYNPTTDAWTEKAPMPTPRVSFAIALYQNKIYTFGGQIIGVTGNREVVNVTEVYDPATDTWATKAQMPHLGEDFAANVVVDNKIYVISTYTDVYDPVTDSWTTKTTIPTAVAHSANAVVDDKIYVISGTHHGDDPNLYAPINLTQMYDPKTDTWSSGAPIPTSVASPAAVATTGFNAPKAIYVVGGLTLTSMPGGGFMYDPQNLVQVYFPENNSWSMGTSMPTARYALGVAAVNDKLYALGGSVTRISPDLTNNELYLPLGYGTVTSKALPQGVIYGVAVAAALVIVVVVIMFVMRKRKNKA
jgi:N-acetylneuraminic acid mutarotase